MNITSTVFEDGGLIPSKYTCNGEGISPPLEISNVPPIFTGEEDINAVEDVKSLAMIVEDPDAPGGMFVHWMVWNLPPSDLKIENGVIPNGIEGKNSSGTIGWKAICPPDNEHRYFFKVYALRTELYLDPQTSNREDFLRAIEGNIIEQCEIMGRYSPTQA